MRNKLFIASFFAFAATWSLASAQQIQVNNNSDNVMIDYVTEIPVEQLNLKVGTYKVERNNEVAPLEIITDIWGKQKAIFPIANLKNKSLYTFKLVKGDAYDYPKRTYAELAHKIGGRFERKDTEKSKRNEYMGQFSWVKPNYLRVPDNFTDHAYYIKYEGPGWESDMTAFRFYLDWRNAIDVFGKKTKQIVLPFVGVDNYETYHHMAPWGMDNMKVGESLGIGSIAIWNGEKAQRAEKTDSVICQIPADGKIRSQVLTDYYGWDANGTKCNLKSLISIDAGSRASHMELIVDKKLNNLATGIVKIPDTEIVKSENTSNEWSYFGTFGKQSLNKDMQGLVIFYRTKALKEITGDKLSHVVVLQPDAKGYVEYYFMPTWELDNEPVVTIADFKKCINEVMNRLNTTPVVKTIK